MVALGQGEGDAQGFGSLRGGGVVEGGLSVRPGDSWDVLRAGRRAGDG